MRQWRNQASPSACPFPKDPPRGMGIVGGTINPEVCGVMGTTEGKGADVVDVEVPGGDAAGVGAPALVAEPDLTADGFGDVTGGAWRFFLHSDRSE